MVGFGWAVLAMVFLDEVLAMVAFGIWGWQVGSPRLLLVVVLPIAAMVAWFLFASPRALYGGPLVRPVAKVVVFGLACLALYNAGHPRWAWTLLGFSVVVNAAALHPRIHALAVPEDGRLSPRGGPAPRR